MFRLFLTIILIVGVSATGFSKDEDSIVIPVNVEAGKSLHLSVHYIETDGTVKVEATEEVGIILLRQENDKYIYETVSKGITINKMEGLPPGFDELMSELITNASGLSFQYAADNTAYPTELIETKNIRKFMKKMHKGMKKWSKKFAKAEKLDKQKKKQMQVFLDQAMAPLLTKDSEELSRLILEEGQLIFNVTGRQLYLDHYSDSVSSRYYDKANAYFVTQESWFINEYFVDDGTAKISMTSVLHPEEYDAFLGRLKPIFEKKYNKAQVERLMGIWSKFVMNREATYNVDLKSGLPTSGTITSETTLDGKVKSKIINFTMIYE